jgi:Ner family transcriptional regulator
MSPVAWDRHAIKAEIHRRGSTLTEVALAAGLHSSTCRVALIRPLPAGEAAIAAFLGIAKAELWPTRYGTSTRGNISTPPDTDSESLNRSAA